jgi:hypothetical protein
MTTLKINNQSYDLLKQEFRSNGHVNGNGRLNGNGHHHDHGVLDQGTADFPSGKRVV